MVTISHYEMPYHLVEKNNGWLGRDTIDCFERFAKTILDRYHDRVKWWLTINEINLGAFQGGDMMENSIIRGFEGPASATQNTQRDRYQALHHQFVASGRVVRYAHEHYPEVKMGNMEAFGLSYAATCDPADELKNQLEMRRRNWYAGDVQCGMRTASTSSTSCPATSRTSATARWTSTPTATTRAASGP